MKFFVPFTAPELAEEMYLHLHKVFPAKPSNRRIFRIEYQKEFVNYTVQVGEIEPRYGGLVFAILEYAADTYAAVYFEGECSNWRPKLKPKLQALVLGREDILRLVEFEEGLREYPLKVKLDPIMKRLKKRQQARRHRS
jgi:hypothetical protein